ncbi:MAG: arginine repressor [Gammaproteobacteria bacterium]|nr:arginine repressor [Gammaproteobacteria bacterium]
MTLDEAILQLVEQREITDQSVFLDLLNHAGHAVTQPTLSRHLKKLGIHKVTGRYQQVELMPDTLPVFALTQVPPNLVIIRTRPGYAQPLAVKLDQQKIEGVGGTLAGDDTVFIAVASPTRFRAVADAVEMLLSGVAAV